MNLISRQIVEPINGPKVEKIAFFQNLRLIHKIINQMNVPDMLK